MKLIRILLLRIRPFTFNAEQNPTSDNRAAPRLVSLTLYQTRTRRLSYPGEYLRTILTRDHELTTDPSPQNTISVVYRNFTYLLLIPALQKSQSLTDFLRTLSKESFFNNQGKIAGYMNPIQFSTVLWGWGCPPQILSRPLSLL